jgi:hypothetical protein
MHRLARLIVTLLAVSLSITALGGPAAAAAPRLTIVQGSPGRTVEVCVGNNEIRPRLRYGAWFERAVPAGNRVVRFRTASPGECTGTLLGHKALDLEANEDLALVITARSPRRVVVFDNTGLGGLEPAAAVVIYAFRHAADLGDLTFKVGELPEVLAPAADPVWEKGDQLVGGSSGDGLVGVAITRPDSHKALASVAVHWGGASGSFRQEFYAVGTNVRNAKVVTIKRAIQL